MEDIGKELGLAYAKTLPGAIGISAIMLIGIVWLGFKAGGLGESWQGPARFGLAVLGIIIVVQLPAAYSSAKDYCREEWTSAGATRFTYDAPVAYRLTKCMSVWPHGPDR